MSVLVEERTELIRQGFTESQTLGNHPSHRQGRSAMTRFQRINLGIGLAALALVACMAVSQTQARLGAESDAGSAIGTR